jgi:hypothetical protein
MPFRKQAQTTVASKLETSSLSKTFRISLKKVKKSLKSLNRFSSDETSSLKSSTLFNKVSAQQFSPHLGKKSTRKVATTNLKFSGTIS